MYVGFEFLLPVVALWLICQKGHKATTGNSLLRFTSLAGASFYIAYRKNVARL
jgi:hypothetical protein